MNVLTQELQMANLGQSNNIDEEQEEIYYSLESGDQPVAMNNQIPVVSRNQTNRSQQFSRNISGGPSSNQSLLFYDFQADNSENVPQENNPTLQADVRRAIFQAQFICLLFLTFTSCKILLTLIVPLVCDTTFTPVSIWILMMLSYDILYLSHNISIMYRNDLILLFRVMLPRTPMHAFFIYYDSNDPSNQDTNLSGFILGQCWSIYQPINGLTVMDSCERFYKMIVGIGEFLRVYYIVIFLYGNIIFYTGIQSSYNEYFSYTLVATYIITGYIYLIIPLFLCIFWPCLLVVIYCVPTLQPDRPQRPLKKKVFEYLQPKRRSEIVPIATEGNCCAICYLEYSNDSLIVELPCNEAHYFHTECCQKWLQINGTCPICRCDVEKTFREKKK